MSNAPTSPANERQQLQRQLQVLQAAVLRCLPAAAHPREDSPGLWHSLEASLQAWRASRDAGDEVLARVITLMQQAANNAGSPMAGAAAEAATAFARAVVAQASDDIAGEARRAGHQTTFDGLQPWLQAPLPVDIAETLAQQLQREPAHLQLALTRLRRRFRQRVEAGLALWSVTTEQRNRLRRQLHAALSSGDSQS